MFYVTTSLLLMISFLTKYGDLFEIPEVTLEAYKPKGFKASIPASPQLQQFVFHANVNKQISQSETGDVNGGATQKTGKIWSFFQPDLELKVGNLVNYWIFIQNENLGYRREGIIWNVTELLELKEGECQISDTVATGKSEICSNSVIFEEEFKNNKIDQNKWTVEQYIPNSQNFEFVSYENDDDACSVKSEALVIKPKPVERNVIDFRQKGCTKEEDSEELCYAKNSKYIVPPVISGKISSKFRFRYGEVEVKAKLPAGDWIYPQIYLEREHNHNHTLWIAHARGNNKYLGGNGEDIGNTLLSGGLVFYDDGTRIKQYLKNRRGRDPYAQAMHVYKVRWTKDEITLTVDNVAYGKLETTEKQPINFSEGDMVRLVLGVGVGGIYEFPETTNNEQGKPWKNTNPQIVRRFWEKRNEWSKTWVGDEAALKVDYVKVTAL